MAFVSLLLETLATEVADVETALTGIYGFMTELAAENCDYTVRI